MGCHLKIIVAYDNPWQRKLTDEIGDGWPRPFCFAILPVTKLCVPVLRLCSGQALAFCKAGTMLLARCNFSTVRKQRCRQHRAHPSQKARRVGHPPRRGFREINGWATPASALANGYLFLSPRLW